MLNEKNYTFWDLISEYKITIPMIQRDYAQGRQDAKTENIRNTFLDVLLSAITTTGESISLDFVYGSARDGIFIPLDGQQRLTTLFLLHWYVAFRSGNLESAKKELKKFTYETRTSSKDFCTALVEANEGNLKTGIADFLIRADKNKTKADTVLSDAIQDASWFFHAWKKDPTVKSMLIMLDAIHQKLSEISDFKLLWQKLIISEVKAITFHFLPIDNFGLTDELYIKMNARGKALTDFENFKAKLEKDNENFKWENKYNKAWQELLDTDWADLFWEYRDKNNDNYLIDDEYMNFFEGMELYFQNLENKKDEDNLLFLFSSLELLRINIDNIVKELEGIKFYSIEDKQSLFEAFIKGSITYKDRAYFYAIVIFLFRWQDENMLKYLAKYMRVIRNLVENIEIDNKNLANVIKTMQNLANICGDDFYEELAKDNTDFGGFEQLKEEKIKARILQNTSNQREIFETEDCTFFKGRIIFALFCIDSDIVAQNFDANKLLEIKNIFDTYFSSNDISNDIRRAFFTIKNNDFYNYWGSWSYSTDTWKRCLIENTTDLKNNFVYNNHWREYFKDLVNKMISKTPQDIANDYNRKDWKNWENWKEKLIKEPKLLDTYCKGHYIGVATNEKYCLLFGNKKRAKIEDCEKIE